MAFGLSESIRGQVSNFIGPHATIVGKSIANYLDSANTSASNETNTAGSFCTIGMVFGTPIQRKHQLYKISLAYLPRRIEVAQAYFVLVLSGRSNNMTGPITMTVHAVEGELGTGTTWLLRATGTTWYGGGYGPAPGYDYNATPLDSVVVSATDIASLPSTTGGGSLPVTFDVTEAVQYRRDAGSDLQIYFPETWATEADVAGGSKTVGMTYATTAASLNTYLHVYYWPALGVMSAANAESGRPPDFTKLHNPDLAGNDYRTWLNVVEQGTTGNTVKLWAWNFRRSGVRRDVIVGTSRAETTTVDSSLSVSGITLRSADVYDTAAGEGTPTGDWSIAAVSGTTYSVTYTDTSGVATVLAEESTGLTAVTFAADHVFMYASNRALKIRTVKWSATTGANVSDRWRFSTRGDLRTTQSLDTLGMVQFVPPDETDQDLADTARARFAKYAYTQQIRAAAYNQDIGGVIRGHLAVHDTTNTQWATGASAWASIFTPGGTTVVNDMKIVTVYPTTDGTYPDTLRLDRAFTAPELAAFAPTTTSVTGGLYLGDFAKSAVQRVASGGVASGSGTLPLDAAFSFGTPAKVWIVSPSAGTNEQVSVLSGTGTLTLATTLTNSYSGGDLVFAVLDPSNPTDLANMSGRPYYVQGVVPATEPEGLYSGYYELYEQKVV